MYELSEDDEKQIAIYCARATAKYNRTLQQGALNIRSAIPEDERTSAKSSIADADEIIAADEGDIPGTDTGADDTALDIEYDAGGSTASPDESVDGSDVSGDSTDASQTAAADAPVDESGATLKNAPGLGHALGVPELKFSFVRATDVTNYSFDGYFDLSPSPGNHFLVLEYQVFNSSKEDVDLNVPALGVSFRATVDGAANTSDRTILLNDISSFNGTIKARKKQDMVMLFQFDPTYLKDLGNIQLQVISGDEKTLVDMR